MTTTEKLEKLALISARCREKLDLCKRNGFPSGCEEAGWRSTLAAIERCKTHREIGSGGDSIVGDSVVAAVMFYEIDIINAWTNELL